ALDRREGPDAALALQADHALVEATPEHHRAVEGLQVAGGELRVERGVQVALAVENRQVFDLEPRLEDGSGHDRSSTLILPLADNQRIINGGPKIPPHGRTAMANVTRRWFVTCGALLVTAAAADLEAPRAQPAPASAGPPDPKLVEDLVAANRILVDQSVLDGYGHVSARHARRAASRCHHRARGPHPRPTPGTARPPPSPLPPRTRGELRRRRPGARLLSHRPPPWALRLRVRGAPLQRGETRS